MGIAPQSPEELEKWLRNYTALREELLAMGYYHVPSDTGTKVQSNRPGDPTQRTALAMSELSEHCRTVEGWLRDLSPVEMDAAQWYISGDQTVQQLADKRGWKFHEMRAVVDGLPYVLWSRFYEKNSAQPTCELRSEVVK